jgi:flagellar hook-associated protein 2
MSSSPSSLFTGSSTYSADFAQVITRAVGIASLPITLLNTQKTTLSAENDALTKLSASFSSLQATLYSVGSTVGGGNYTVSSSDSTVANASASAGALFGTYHIEVADPGSQARAASTATVADPTTTSISIATSFTLTANGTTFNNITPASNTLTSLADAINTATQGAVQATIVNVGTTSSPSYQLSIQNSKYGPAASLPITLDDGLGSGNILGTPTTATSVQYRVNGQPVSPAVNSDNTRTLTISPNLSVTVLNVGTTDITVGQSTAGIANALSGFVTAYNAASQALDGQRGSSGGALVGQSIISTLSQSLHDITNYSATGSIQSMSDLGLAFDPTTFELTFDSTKLSATAATNFKGVTDFLGNTTTGGFLKAATDTLNGLTDSTSGIIPMVILSTAGEITDTQNQIDQNQARVDQLTLNLKAQMAASDALIASLQQQATYMTDLFTAMTANQYSMR